MVVDLCVLSAAAYEAFAPRLDRPFVLNPTFAGSGDVGNADADLILDGCLLEIKATKRPLKPVVFHQLLGYVLLDYEDVYAIRRVGIYLARRGVMVEWPLLALVAQLSGGRAASLATLRAAFREAVQADPFWSFL
jgi:hypothetical protein